MTRKEMVEGRKLNNQTWLSPWVVSVTKKPHSKPSLRNEAIFNILTANEFEIPSLRSQ
ncbi:MAG: hypothetical protein ACJA2S_005453 [Cyclobacteriaceae bacterium]|jgi:hypothetical protein